MHSYLYNNTREEFLEKLINIAPKNLTQVHLNNSGAEAVEAAIKFARKFTGKKGMIAMNGSYHGKSMGALSLTFNPKYRKIFQPLVEKVSFSRFGDIDSLRSTIDDETGAIVFSPSTIFNRSSELYVKFEGLDLSNVDPDNVQFIDQTTDNNVYPVQYESLDIDISSGIIELKVEPFIVDYSQISYNVMEIGGARYGFTR